MKQQRTKKARQAAVLGKTGLYFTAGNQNAENGDPKRRLNTDTEIILQTG